MSYLYLCLLVVQYFEDSKQLWSYTDLNVSTALYILLVMRISIVILYLIVVHGYIEYKKRPPQSDTSVHVCVFVLYIAVMVIFHFHIVSLCFLTIFYGNSFHFGSQTQWYARKTHGLPCPKRSILRESSHRKTRFPASPSDGQSCAA